MRVIILGGNSYIAKSFINSYHDKFDLKIIKRSGDFQDYFSVKVDDFVGFDTVINFTAIVHKKGVDEEKHQKYNYELVRYLADLAKSAGVKHFVQLSTIAVYGKENYIDRDTRPNPHTAYGKAKLAADNYLLSLKDKKFQISIIRPPMVYGKDAPGNMHSLIKLLSFGLPLPLNYRYNKRSIIFIENLTLALFEIVNRQKSGIFLLRDQKIPSLGEIVMTIKEEGGYGYNTPLMAPPKFFVTLLMRLPFGVFEKLYGDLLIDDSHSIEQLGRYNRVDFKSAVSKMIEK